MANNNIIALWGSPGSGTTLTSVKIARELASCRKNVVLIFCDSETPMLPVIVPSAEDAKSLGELLAMPSISQVDIFTHCLPIWKTLTALGYLKGENETSWADYSEGRAEELLDMLGSSADFIVLDCSHHLLTNVLTGVALETAGTVFRIANASPKSLSYISSQRPILSDPKFRYGEQVSIINNIYPFQDAPTYKNLIGGKKIYTLPHLLPLMGQAAECRLLEPLEGRDGKAYEPKIRLIVQSEILGKAAGRKDTA